MSKIYITKGTGKGSTSISAFDAALEEAGIADYNLIYLSSIVPPGSDIEIQQFVAPEDEYGHRLYIVMARRDAKNIGEEAWAGVGWSQSEDNRGLFVEHHGRSEKEVNDLIQNSLKDMFKYRPRKHGDIQHCIAGIKCEDEPVCALVAAVFMSKGWN